MSDAPPSFGGSLELRRLTSVELGALFARGPVAVLVPVGSVEPHGPHLPLGTDTTLGEESANRAARRLTDAGTTTLVAPAIPYGVTDFARGFPGAVGIDASLVTRLVATLARALLAEGFAHVCFVSHHLEPAHDAAVRAGAEGNEKGRVSVASPLSRRWGRLLSDEYKSGACHAGRYETSLVLAAADRVAFDISALPDLDVSLSKGIAGGLATFLAMGMTDAYTGSPAHATREEGEALYEKHVAMIVAEVTEALASRPES